MFVAYFSSYAKVDYATIGRNQLSPGRLVASIRQDPTAHSVTALMLRRGVIGGQGSSYIRKNNPELATEVLRSASPKSNSI